MKPSECDFINPPGKYRGTPFWAWNGRLEREILREQIDRFHEMGMGGFCIHCRVGLDTEYLGDEFMELVRFCNRYGREKGLVTWLYDEDKWPSGYGGGRVTKEEAYRSRYLLFSKKEYPEGLFHRALPQPTRLVLDGRIKKICAYEVKIDRGLLSSWRKLSEGEKAEGGDEIWYAYLVVSENASWFNNQTYLDTLNRKAAETFLAVTHERYREALGEEFSKSIPAIFTDEPQFILKENFACADGAVEAGIPYTDDFEETFQKAYGSSFLENLPCLFWETADGRGLRFRYWYHDHAAERFCRAYCDTVGAWCRKNHISLTGHVMNESTLEEQTKTVGEAMRAYRGFQIPGIDMLARRTEYTTAKQAESAANQYGCEGITSELYGVTNWDFDFRGHKAVGDWQAALGVVNRVHHLSWYSMGGEAKRDYPASIGGQSPWYGEYGRIETYFARIRMLLAEGKPVVRIGVIHPVESAWILFGPDDQTGQKRSDLEAMFQDTSRWLLEGQLDFDYICESLLPSQAADEKEIGRPVFSVGAMDYDAVLVTGMDTIRGTTLKRLKAFRDRGGLVLFMGEAPTYVDAVRCDGAVSLARQAVQIPRKKAALYQALADVRELYITEENGRMDQTCLYRMKEDDEGRRLFIAPMPRLDWGIPEEKRRRVWIRGLWYAEEWDAMSGKRARITSHWENGWTWLNWNGYEQDSLLLWLSTKPREALGGADTAGEKASAERPGWEKKAAGYAGTAPRRILMEGRLLQPTRWALEEQNTCLLDMASARLDEGAEGGPEEILKLDDCLRKRLNYPLRTEGQPQPWLTEKRRADHRVTLSFAVYSETETAVCLAAEGSIRKMVWNGEEKEVKAQGWYVDPAIRTYPLGSLRKEENRLILELEYGPKENLEWCYLLGDFEVEVRGCEKKILPKRKTTSYGDITRQGLAFYGGNLWYETDVYFPEGELEVGIPHFAAPLLMVSVDGQEETPIIQSPYRAALGRVKEGFHTIRIRCFGSRFSTFGQLHHCDQRECYFGPKTWRTEGDAWCYEYRMRPTGILAAPRFWIYE